MSSCGDIIVYDENKGDFVFVSRPINSSVTKDYVDYVASAWPFITEEADDLDVTMERLNKI